jgi:hypothetical protein
MTLDPKAKSQLNANHRREREEQNDTHRGEHEDLKHMQRQRREREVAEARKHGGRSDTRLMSDDDNAKRVSKEKAELNAKQRREYKQLTAGHAKEEADAEKTGKMPARHMMLHEAKKIGGMGMNPKEMAQYKQTLSRHTNEQNSLHNKLNAEKDRLSRYKSSAMTAKMENDRLAKHDELSRKHEREMASLRRSVQFRRERARP